MLGVGGEGFEGGWEFFVLMKKELDRFWKF